MTCGIGSDENPKAVLRSSWVSLRVLSVRCVLGGEKRLVPLTPTVSHPGEREQQGRGLLSPAVSHPAVPSPSMGEGQGEGGEPRFTAENAETAEELQAASFGSGLNSQIALSASSARLAVRSRWGQGPAHTTS
ncbi:TPA: hypothetical protein DCY67_02120 [Candidatus Acetothermia bacterium]|nr:hypothetical protein [Candidatus Acetothermia bacterium]